MPDIKFYRLGRLDGFVDALVYRSNLPLMGGRELLNCTNTIDSSIVFSSDNLLYNGFFFKYDSYKINKTPLLIKYKMSEELIFRKLADINGYNFKGIEDQQNIYLVDNILSDNTLKILNPDIWYL